jgi:hypothetical protein
VEHSEFVRAWNEGKLEIEVDRSKALRIVNLKTLPKRYQAAHLFWSWVWILSIPGSLAVMYLYEWKWWEGLLLVVFLSPVVYISTKKASMQFMIDHALKNQEFYQFAVTGGAIRVKPKP